MLDDYVEPWDPLEMPRAVAQQDYEHRMMDEMAEESLERSVAKAEEAADALEEF